MKQVKDILEPQPSVAIVKFWQGIGEIALRAACIVLCCVAFICAAVASTHTAFPTASTLQNHTYLYALRDSTHGVAGWIIFVCLVGIVYEGVFITLRFVNLSIVEKYIGFVLITDIVIHVIFFLSWFIQGIIMAVFGGTEWPGLQVIFGDDPTVINQVNFSSIESSCVATAVFLLLFAIPVYVTLTIWIGVWLFARWQQNVTRILRNQAGPTDQDTEDLDPSQEDF